MSVNKTALFSLTSKSRNMPKYKSKKEQNMKILAPTLVLKISETSQAKNKKQNHQFAQLLSVTVREKYSEEEQKENVLCF